MSTIFLEKNLRSGENWSMSWLLGGIPYPKRTDVVFFLLLVVLCIFWPRVDSEEMYFDLLRTGRLAGEKGSHDRAIGLYGTALEFKPEGIEAFIWRAESYRALGKKAEAERDFQRATEIDSGRSEPFFHRARFLFEAGRLFPALQDLNRAISINPAEAEYYFLRGKISWILKDDSRARSDFEKLIQLDPSRGEGHYELSLVLISLGQTENAMEEMRKARDLDYSPAFEYFPVGIQFDESKILH